MKLRREKGRMYFSQKGRIRPGVSKEQGREVRMVISGSSMAPFLIHGRDSIFFRAPARELRKGDIVFYERPGGQFVVHRICRVHAEGYDIIGDAQTEIEHHVQRKQIFAPEVMSVLIQLPFSLSAKTENWSSHNSSHKKAGILSDPGYIWGE